MNIFTPIKIGNVELKNRIMFPPLTTSFEERGGVITPKSIEFYRGIAKGGAGLIVIGDVSAVSAFSKTPTLHHDGLIEGHKSLTDAVHKEGSKIAAQIFYPEVDPDIIVNEMKAKGMPTAMKLYNRLFNEFVNEVDKEGIEKIQNLIVDVAVRAKKAGYDILQLHGDRLIGMFCSPILNKRTDEYGGSFENRARFVLEVMDKLRASLPDMPIEYKMSIIRMNPRKGFGGPTLEEAKVLVRWLEEKGVNSFHVALANHGELINTIPGMGMEPYGCFLDLSEAIKSVATVPVSCVGRILRPSMVKEILEEGKADIVALGRQLVADPDWPVKVQEGREDEIRYCIMCNKGCTDKLLAHGSIECSINPNNGLEKEVIITEAESKKKIVVVGGGVAGIEAACTAAERGHTVILLEKEEKLFGQLNIAMAPPNKSEMERLMEYYLKKLKRLNIEVRTGTAATVEIIKELNCDKVIIATGATEFMPKFNGMDNMKVVSAWEILSGKEELKGKIAVIGAGFVGIETAEYIGEKNKEAFVVELSDKILNGENVSNIKVMMKNLQDHNIEIFKSHKLLSIEKDHIKVQYGEEIKEMPCDMVVVAIGAKPDKTLSKELTKAGINHYLIGDCKMDNVRLIGDAVRDGFNLAVTI